MASGQWSVVSDEEQAADAHATANLVGSPAITSLQSPITIFGSSPITDHQPLITRRPRRLAFTLTELLVVIAIMAVLAALASVAVVRGLDTAKQTRMKVEVDALDAAFKSYKEKYGSYPPCDLRFDPNASKLDNNNNPNPLYNAALRQHLAKAFPRYSWGTATQLDNDLRNAGVDTKQFRPDQALVFWLSTLSTNVSKPFEITGARQSFFDFDKSRLFTFTSPGYSPPGAGINGVASYFPTGIKVDGTQGAYVYFEAGMYGDLPKMIGIGAPAFPNAFNFTTVATPQVTAPTALIFSEAGTAVPYWSDLNLNGKSHKMGLIDTNEGWINPDSFQIIAPGGDGKYGTPESVRAHMYPTDVTESPSATPTASDDEDNVTNFCNKARLGDAKP